MVWTRLLSSPSARETASKPAAMDAASAISTLIPTASGAPASRRLPAASSRAAAAPGHHRDAGSFCCQRLRDRQAHALAAARHDGCRSGQAQIHRSVIVSLGAGATPSPRKQKRTIMFADVGAIAIAGRPLPFGAGPDHALYRTVLRPPDRCRGTRPAALAALELFDERLEHLGVGALTSSGAANICDLRLQRQAGADRI